MPLDRVVELCNITLVWIKKERNRSDSIRINFRIESDFKRKQFWAKIFRFKPKELTRDEAYNRLRIESLDDFSYSWFPSRMHTKNEIDTERILELAVEAQKQRLKERDY